MYYKKVWIIILIIVIMGSLFPSVLIAKADEGDGGGGAGGIPVEGGDNDIPDREYSLQDAPFPGTYGKITEESWQSFINHADELGHTEIRKVTGYIVYFTNGTTDENYYSNPIYYSTNGNDLIDEFSTRQWSWGTYSVIYKLTYEDLNNKNVLNFNEGHNGPNSNTIIGFDKGYGVDENNEPLEPYKVEHTYEIWYNAEVINDEFQNKPEQYNIDPTRGWGMYFLKPKFGEWINIPTKTYSHRDTIEIEIQVPHLYESNNWNYELFKITKGIEKGVIPNFAIRLYSNNVKKIEGSQVVGRDGTWILPYNIKFIEGYMDGTYMHGAKFIATVPMEHAKNANWETSLIVADLFIHEEPFEENYSIRIPEARTWTKYHIFYGIVDSDGDGFDDRTGEPINQPKPEDIIKDDKPNKDDYDEGILGTISYYFDTFIWYIKQPFVFIANLIGNIINWISTTIDGWIDGFTSIFTKLFSFLPAEVILMLALGFGTMMIITIIRAIRGS